MPLEVILRLIGLLIGGFLPTDKQVNHILTPYMTYFYAHRLGRSTFNAPQSANTTAARSITPCASSAQGLSHGGLCLLKVILSVQKPIITDKTIK